MGNTKTDTLASTYHSISKTIRDYVTDEDSRLKLEYKLFLCIENPDENTQPRGLFASFARGM